MAQFYCRQSDLGVGEGHLEGIWGIPEGVTFVVSLKQTSFVVSYSKCGNKLTIKQNHIPTSTYPFPLSNKYFKNNGIT